MMYKALCVFRDLQDKHLYAAGDIFPHDGREISAERINELTSAHNAAKMPLIEPAEAPKTRRRAPKK